MGYKPLYTSHIEQLKLYYSTGFLIRPTPVFERTPEEEFVFARQARRIGPSVEQACKAMACMAAGLRRVPPVNPSLTTANRSQPPGQG